MKNRLIAISAFLLTFTLALTVYAQVNPRTLGDIFGFRAVVITKQTGTSDPRAGALHIGRLGTEFPTSLPVPPRAPILPTRRSRAPGPATSAS